MAIIPSAPGFGELLATGLGKGLGTGLENLAQYKLQQLAKQQQVSEKTPLFTALGYTPEQARSYAGADPRLQVEAMKQARFQQAAQKMDGLGLGETEAGAEIPSQPKYSPDEKAILQNAYQLAKATGDLRPLQQAQIEIFKTQEKRAAEARKATTRQTELGFKQTEKYREKVLSEEKNLAQQKNDLQTMIRLRESGKLTSPAYAKMTEYFDLPWLLNKESSQYKKSARTLLRRLIGTIKGRPSELIVKKLEEGLPSLTMNSAGAAAVEKALLNSVEIEELDAKKMREIMKENKGIPPLDLAERVAEEIAPERERLTQEFERRITEAVASIDEDLPPVSAGIKGDKLRNKETGKVEFIHDGTKWRKI